MGVSAAEALGVALVRQASGPLQDPTSSRSLDDHLASLRTELEQARHSGNQAKANHLQSELNDLEAYRAHNPEASKDPTPLEVYCDLNPQAPECLVYDD
jgi:hypothetical protein